MMMVMVMVMAGNARDLKVRAVVSPVRPPSRVHGVGGERQGTGVDGVMKIVRDSRILVGRD
jgi:hypothetical protein